MAKIISISIDSRNNDMWEKWRSSIIGQSVSSAILALVKKDLEGKAW